MLHYTFVKKHIWLYVTRTLLFQTVPSVCVSDIKADWYIGSNSRGAKLCQWSKGNHQRLFSTHSTSGWRDLQGLIVHQLEAADILSLCFDCSLYCGLPAFPPKWHALTPDWRNLKVPRRSLGTHTHKTNTHKHKSSIDPKVNPWPWPPLPLQEQSPAGIHGKKKKHKKVGFKKKSGWVREWEIKTEEEKNDTKLIVLEWIKGDGRKTLHLELLIKVIPTGNLS